MQIAGIGGRSLLWALISTTALTIAGCGGGSSSTAKSGNVQGSSHEALTNGSLFKLPLNSDATNAQEVPYAGSDTGSRQGGISPRGTQIGNQYSYEGVRFFDQCVLAMISFYKGRYGINLPSTGGDLGAYNYGNPGRTISGMTRIDNVASDPKIHDMIVIDKYGGGGVGKYGHVMTVAQTLGNRVVMAVDSNWIGVEKGGVHTMDLKQYKIRCYFRPNKILNGLPPQPWQSNDADVTYRGHFADIGDFDTVARGEILGTQNENRRQEAVQIQANGRHISYQVHVANIGWMNTVADGALAGSTGRGLQLEAIRIWVNRGTVTYYVHVQNKGWLGPYRNGDTAGTENQSLRIEAMAVHISN